MTVTHPVELQRALHHSMLRMRRVEEIVADEYRTGSMRTPTHLGIGQEAVAAGVCQALEPSDTVYSHHRCHLHYLAKGGSLLGLLAELFGREAGCSRGRGGSVHLTDRPVGFIGSSPILGQGIALATGTALAYQMDGVRNVVATFFGEGACDEGAVYEAFNFASIRRLPVVYVCENNLYATETPLSARQAPDTDLCERARAFKIEARRVDGNDALAVHDAASEAIARCREGRGPFFLECMTYRWREHVGPMWDHEIGRQYRSREEVEQWMERCPVKRLAASLVAAGHCTQADLDAVLAGIDREVLHELEVARSSPWPDASTLFQNVY